MATAILGSASTRWNDYVGTAAADAAEDEGRMTATAFVLSGRGRVEDFLNEASGGVAIRLVAREFVDAPMEARDRPAAASVVGERLAGTC